MNLNLKIANVTNRVATVYLYGEIGWDVDSGKFVQDLAELDVDKIVLRVNSPGGDVYHGLAVMNALKSHPAKVEAVIEAMAFSAASFIVAGAADKVVAHEASEIMVHDAITYSYGNSEDMGRTIDRLERMSNTLAEIYAQRAGGTAEQWRNAMKLETWFSATEALEAGLVDSLWDAEELPAESVNASGKNYAIMNRFKGRRADPPQWLISNTDKEGKKEMDFKNRVANKLGVKSEDLTEDAVLLALDEALEERADQEEPSDAVEVNLDNEEADEVEAEAEAEPENADVVTLDRETFEDLQRMAKAGAELAQKQADEKLVAEVDQWVNDGRISSALRNRALEAIRRDPDSARSSFGSNPVGTIPRKELGTSVSNELQDGARHEDSPRTRKRRAGGFSGTGLAAAPKFTNTNH